MRQCVWEPNPRSDTLRQSTNIHFLSWDLQPLVLHGCYCNPMDCCPPVSSVHGILQARILEWVPMPSFRGSSCPRDRTCMSGVSWIGRKILYHWAGFNPWVGKIPWRRKWQPTPVLLPGKIPWTEKPGRLQSMGSQRVGHAWVTSLFFFSFFHLGSPRAADWHLKAGVWIY